MERLLRELGHELRAQADPRLLDLPLDDLCNQVADTDARELLAGVHEAGAAGDLRTLLEDDGLARYVAAHCTLREAEILVRQLRRWLGEDERGGDDPERLARVPAPPEDAEGLVGWAHAHGVERALYDPAERYLAARELPPEVLLVDACLGRAGRLSPSRSLLAGERIRDEARAALHALARHIAAREVRARLHLGALPGGTVGVLARRLRALFADESPEALAAHRFVPARPVEVARESGLARGALVTQAGAPPIELALYLSGFEQRALEGRCSACATPRCSHLAALAARLFEALMEPEDRLHEALEKLGSVPSWQRFLSAVTPDAERHASPANTPRITFALRLTGQQLSVGVLLSRARADGRPSAGKLVSPAKLARAAGTTDRDRVVLVALAARTRTLGPQYVPADLTVLRALVEHPSVLLERTAAKPHGTRDPERAAVALVESQLEVTLRAQPEGLAPRVSLAGHALTSAPAVRDVGYALHHDAASGRLSFAALSPPLTRLLTALEHFRGVLPPESYPQLAAWLETLRSVALVERPKELEGLARPPPERLLLRISPRFDEGIDVALRVRALPLAPLWSPGEGPELVHGLCDGKPSSVRRELARERAQAHAAREALGLEGLLELGPYSYRVESTQAALALLGTAARLGELLELEWAERARSLRIAGSVRASDLKVGLLKRGDFCALSGGAQHGEQLIAVDRLLEAARTGERFVPIGGGDYLEIEATLFARLHEAQLCTLSIARERLLPAGAAPHWLAKLGDETNAGDDPTAAWLAAVRRADDDEVALDPEFAALLRGYQREGLAFLLSVSRWATGACLADEMGLGKTVQAIGLLRARAESGPQLVIAPTSVVDNWVEELARFAPGLTAVVYRGPDRERALATLGPAVVLVTSYELLLRDRARFDAHAFTTLVADEAQVLRNARTLRARAVASLAADFRLALSGTPIENRLGDLWSLFQLVSPGLLGSWARFRARFAVPIERYENTARAEALRALVAPLLLRREKCDVLPELPPRTEVVRLVELSQAERDLYGAALLHARRALGKRKRDEATRAVQILAELTALRQLACHPRLVLGDSRVGSSKLALLMELLEDLLPRGHRVLVFSQFTRHLALVREAVDARGVAHCTLDGSMSARERRTVIARFQGGDVPLFLISLKAGGTGLNLTAADYVVHMDPWWNPTSEDQASDRAHRIGQERPVTIVKLVAQDTIEERVLELHAHKRRLAGSILGEGTAGGPPALAELEALLAE